MDLEWSVKHGRGFKKFRMIACSPSEVEPDSRLYLDYFQIDPSHGTNVVKIDFHLSDFARICAVYWLSHVKQVRRSPTDLFVSESSKSIRNRPR